jgi:hypothetical protein
MHPALFPALAIIFRVNPTHLDRHSSCVKKKRRVKELGTRNETRYEGG